MCFVEKGPSKQCWFIFQYFTSNRAFDTISDSGADVYTPVIWRLPSQTQKNQKRPFSTSGYFPSISSRTRTWAKPKELVGSPALPNLETETGCPTCWGAEHSLNSRLCWSQMHPILIEHRAGCYFKYLVCCPKPCLIHLSPVPSP